MLKLKLQEFEFIRNNTENIFFVTGKRLKESNAVRTSAAGDGLTEPNRYLHHGCRCKRVSPLGPKRGNGFCRSLFFTV